MDDDSNSVASSAVGMDSFRLTRQQVLPEQWTLPKEWNIEMREMFGNWKLDVQSQIKHLDVQLNRSLTFYPCELSKRPSLFPLTESAEETGEEAKLRLLNSGQMQTGLRRT
ncbi:hypothetical protein CAPTEDRAFT_205282 [Capitella teleta]|uniref:Uncharacterized protein n=1 Tax=Capitella teleta TaxID=283909 RepID=R7VE24_CAPTE|nr:hypothetical protein CAPTEDRAFT_205282 [Capitella teleta]|eukprot:ELU16812.1 hypothetical protein CAPTEDRAFT_205282 [Capitella teleta]